MKRLTNRIDLRGYGAESRLIGILIAIFIIVAMINPGRFLSATNLSTMAVQLPELGLLSLSMLLVVLTGGVNLANVATGALSGIVFALVMSSSYAAGVPDAPSIFYGLLAGSAVALAAGLLNGFFVAIIGVASVLVTLASATLFKGISLNITQGAAISGFPPAFYELSRASVFGIPTLLLIFVVAAIGTHLLLAKTPWGRKVYMVGTNELASDYSGIRVKRVLMGVYVLSAALGFLAVIIMMSRYNSAKVDYGASYVLQSLAACVLGGTRITGGKGSVLGVVTAVAILQVISSGMNILNVNRFFTDIVIGAILIVALALGFLTQQVQQRRHALAMRISQ